MPINYSDYPDNWKTEIRPRILDRARNHCEQCGVRDGSHIRRMVDNPAVYRYWSETDNVFLDSDRRLSVFYDQQNWHPAVKVVLTVAHIDQSLENNADANLAAWCQRCHLMFDQRARNLVVKALAMVETSRLEAGGPFEKMAGKYEKTKYSPARVDGPDQKQAARISAQVQADRVKNKRPRKGKGKP